jgi:hypothetical protein
LAFALEQNHGRQNVRWVPSFDLALIYVADAQVRPANETAVFPKSID